MYDLLKKIFPKDYVKAQKVYEPSSVEVGFKVIQLMKKILDIKA